MIHYGIISQLVINSSFFFMFTFYFCFPQSNIKAFSQDCGLEVLYWVEFTKYRHSTHQFEFLNISLDKQPHMSDDWL